MALTEYVFHNLELVPNCAATVSGVADVEGTEITSISLDGRHKGDAGRQLDSVDPLYKLIERALRREWKNGTRFI